MDEIYMHFKHDKFVIFDKNSSGAAKVESSPLKLKINFSPNIWLSDSGCVGYGILNMDGCKLILLGPRKNSDSWQEPGDSPQSPGATEN